VLAADGYEIVQRPEDADVVLVNTCAVRDHAEQRVIGRVGELYRLKSERPDMVIGVTGCMAQRLGERLLERAPYVDLVMGTDAYRSLPETLARLHEAAPGKRPAPMTASAAPDTPVRRRTLPVVSAPRNEERVAVLDFDHDENYEGLEVHRESAFSAWIPVQRGCNYRCTYCIVPYVRGSEKNRAPERILDEVR